MRKHPESATHRHPTQGQPVFSDDPAQDDPHDAIDQELLGIWISISRLRELIRARPAHRVASKHAAPKKPLPARKQPRRKAA